VTHPLLATPFDYQPLVDDHITTRFGDVVPMRGHGPISAPILWATRHRGEQPSKASHLAFVYQGGPLRSTIVQEATGWRVQRRNLWDTRAGTTTEVAIFRPLNLTPGIERRMRERADKTLGRVYGFGKLPLHLVDGLLGKLVGRDVYFARRAAITAMEICSYDTINVFGAGGLDFGVSKRRGTPDDCLDFIEGHLAPPDPVYLCLRAMAPLGHQEAA
jgi:hypothetical protein